MSRSEALATPLSSIIDDIGEAYQEALDHCQVIQNQIALSCVDAPETSVYEALELQNALYVHLKTTAQKLPDRFFTLADAHGDDLRQGDGTSRQCLPQSR